MSFAVDVQTIVLSQHLADIHGTILRQRQQDLEYAELQSQIAYAQETTAILRRAAAARNAARQREDDAFARVAFAVGRKHGRIA